MIKSKGDANSNSNSNYLSFEKSEHMGDPNRMATLEKKEESLWQTIRESVSEAKKEFKKLNEQLKEELNHKIRARAEVVEEILRTLDSKIEFVIESCEKYGNRIMQHVSGKVNSMEEVDSQGYNQRFELITEKMRVLEQRLYGFKQCEEEMKSRIEVLKEKNFQMTEEYRVMVSRSNERISQLECQLKDKIEEIKRRDNNDAIKFTFVHQNPPQLPTVQAQSSSHNPNPIPKPQHNPQVYTQAPPPPSQVTQQISKPSAPVPK